MQDVGITKLYHIEWEATPFPQKYYLQSLQSNDDKGSLNQHIYNFLLQIEYLMRNNPILTKLFISTLNRPPYIRFRQLQLGTTKP